MLILGIETSCDETAAAVVEDGSRVLGEALASQIAVHARYGGVVPEAASRQHMERIWDTVATALNRASVPKRDLDVVAMTQGPGLVGALLVGISFGKAFAYGLGIPVIAVNHLEGHLISWVLGNDRPALPHVALVVSGGHTELVFVRAVGDHRLLGRTRDDAAGEAFDKGARMFGLEYPGGPAIDRIARRGDASAVSFPRPMTGREDYDFSFSGLKTALRRFLSREPDGDAVSREDLAASYQAAIVDILAEKTMRAAMDCRVTDIVITGGVAANSHLRAVLNRKCAERGMRAWFPSAAYCTDNAAMIAAVAYYRWRSGARDSLQMNAAPDLRLA